MLRRVWFCLNFVSTSFQHLFCSWNVEAIILTCSLNSSQHCSSSSSNSSSSSSSSSSSKTVFRHGINSHVCSSIELCHRDLMHLTCWSYCWEVFEAVWHGMVSASHNMTQQLNVKRLLRLFDMAWSQHLSTWLNKCWDRLTEWKTGDLSFSWSCLSSRADKS